MNIDLYLKRLEEERALLARGALQNPQHRDLFEYGRVVGMYAGLVKAEELLIDLIKERERKDFDL